MDLRAIDHVTLHVHHLDTTRAYYEEVFGFRCTELRSEGSRVLQLESPAVHLFVVESTTIDPECVRNQHLSFEVESLAAVIAELDAREEPYELGEYSGFRMRNYRWCEWRDPEGIRVECVEHIAG